VHLNLASNQLDDDISLALGQFLEKNQALQSLGLEGNKLGPEAAAAVATGLETNTKLRMLTLGWNHIENKGAISLGLSLPKMKGLESLCVVGNDLKEEGFKDLVRGLEQNHQLTRLSLGAIASKGRNGDVPDAYYTAARFYERRNKVAWQILEDEDAMPPALWAHFLYRLRNDADMRFFFLKERPVLFKEIP